MQRRAPFLPIFLICLFITILLFFFFKTGHGQIVTGFFEQITVPLQRLTFQSINTDDPVSESEIQKENKRLLLELAKQKEIEKENKALRDQFETATIPSQHLLPAQVVGLKEEEMVIDKGTSDKLQVGMIVVVKDNVIGRTIKVSPHLSVIQLVSHKNTSFTGETSKTGALGVVKGKGGNQIFLENVVLSEKLEKNDIVKTKGDVDTNGLGYPPDLVVGKIVSVYKRTSALFQTAEIKSMVDFSRLHTVFILSQE